MKMTLDELDRYVAQMDDEYDAKVNAFVEANLNKQVFIIYNPNGLYAPVTVVGVKKYEPSSTLRVAVKSAKQPWVNCSSLELLYAEDQLPSGTKPVPDTHYGEQFDAWATDEFEAHRKISWGEIKE